MRKYQNKAHQTAGLKLRKLNVRTTQDLDALRQSFSTEFGISTESRFGCLKRLVGKEGAFWVLNDLACDVCCK